MRFVVDVRKSVYENADFFYERVKKARQKIRGAGKALERTRARISDLRREGVSVREVPERKRVRKSLKWYERFRFFFSSDGFLVVGGRDASTNEVLIKKQLGEGDLVFHSVVQGAPFFVVKNPGGLEIPGSTRDEAAQAAASYSKAWSADYGAVDVYAVKPEQVSKSAPSGEYLGKGAFMVYGRKTWFRKTVLGIAIGFGFGDAAEVVGGPVEAVRKNSVYFVEVVPGRVKSRALAGEIKERVLSKAKKEYGDRLEAVDLEDIQRLIPAGRGRVKKK